MENYIENIRNIKSDIQRMIRQIKNECTYGDYAQTVKKIIDKEPPYAPQIKTYN